LEKPKYSEKTDPVALVHHKYGFLLGMNVPLKAHAEIPVSALCLLVVGQLHGNFKQVQKRTILVVVRLMVILLSLPHRSGQDFN
jgi:hypothetical protein